VTPRSGKDLFKRSHDVRVELSSGAVVQLFERRVDRHRGAVRAIGYRAW
jgi:hypothetical protein